MRCGANITNQKPNILYVRICNKSAYKRNGRRDVTNNIIMQRVPVFEEALEAFLIVVGIRLVTGDPVSSTVAQYRQQVLVPLICVT